MPLRCTATNVLGELLLELEYQASTCQRQEWKSGTSSHTVYNSFEHITKPPDTPERRFHKGMRHFRKGIRVQLQRQGQFAHLKQCRCVEARCSSAHSITDSINHCGR